MHPHPNKIAITSGGAGDIVFSFPILRALGVGTLLVKESYYPMGYGSLYSAMRPLVELQGFHCLPTRDLGHTAPQFDHFDPDVRYHINMDAWRSCKMRGRWHIQRSMANHWLLRGIQPSRPWLVMDDVPTSLTGQDYTLWFLSPRWRESDTNWHAVYRMVPGARYFIGFEQDWEAFKTLVQDDGMAFLKTMDFLATARLIRDCRALYTNQGPCLAIAQGLGKEYYCAFKHGKTNTMVYTKNEHAI